MDDTALKNFKNELIKLIQNGKTEITVGTQKLLSILEEIESSKLVINSLEYSEYARHLNRI